MGRIETTQKRKCTVDGCWRDVRSPGVDYCGAHYQKLRKYGDPTHVVRATNSTGLCTVRGCKKSNRKCGGPYCEMHYGRLRRNGSFEKQPKPPKKQKGICSVGGCGKIENACGLCSMHFYRLKHWGSLTDRPAPKAREKAVPRACSVADCEAPAKSRGYCPKHYHKLWQYGDALAGKTRSAVKALCRVDGCFQRARARGLCNAHWLSERRHGSPLAAAPRRLHEPGAICAAEGCDKIAKWRKLCRTHYARLLKHGSTAPQARHKKSDGLCSASGCARPARTRGYCDLHYRRFKTHGSTELPIKTCKLCKASFPSKGRGVYCSPTCSAQARHEHHSLMTHRRRSQVKASPSVNFTDKDIFERDAWICWLCGMAINPFVSAPDPAAASVDHVVALSKDGMHVPENCRAAHLRCNSRRNKNNYFAVRAISAQASDLKTLTARFACA